MTRSASGEDGPTHQPVEHVMSLRMIPNLAVFRPADAVETAEAWALALQRTDGPSLLALTRQNLPQVRDDASENLTARGAYRLRSAAAPRRVVLIATGSEVEVALRTAEALEGEGIGADVVSMPCWSLFDAQDAAYRADLLPADTLRVSIEAGTTLGWERYIGRAASRSASIGSALPRPPKTFSSASASPPRPSCRRSRRRCKTREISEHGDQSCDQRVRADRPAGGARHPCQGG
jgi:transketolase